MRILILGGLGMLGHRVYQTLSQQFSQVYVCIRKPAVSVLKYGIYNPKYIIDNVDLLHPPTVENSLKNINPDIVINCACTTSLKMKDLRPSEVIELNALVPQRMSAWCKEHSAQFIHFSTDEVFKGRTQPYTETSTPDSHQIFGRSKALGELLNSQDLIFRSQFLGTELENPTELFSNLILKKNLSVTVHRNKLYNGVTTLFMSQILAEWIHQGIPYLGLFQMSSQPINEFDLAQLINQHFQLNLKIEVVEENKEFRPKILSNKKMITHWPHNTPQWTNMISDLAYDFGKNDLQIAV